MILFKRAEKIAEYIDRQKKEGHAIGFIPTMGALHLGHLTLLTNAKKEGQLTVCSIFVNPTQFNNPEDFKHYPVTIEKDMEQLVSNGCDALFLPSKEEIYPDGYVAKHYELGHLESVLEGFYRPGHFQGVCQVVDRLLEIVGPTYLYLGQKDYQQCKVIERLLTLTGKQDQIRLMIAPTVREADGLAMSSRNLRLSAEQRKIATAIFQSLQQAKKSFKKQSIKEIKKLATAFLEGNGFAVDYFEIANPDTLLPVDTNNAPAIALVAAYLNNIRLIDNLLLG